MDNDNIFAPENYANILDICDGSRHGKYLMADQGAWHGYGINNPDNRKLHGGFKGPVIVTGLNSTHWISPALEQFLLKDSKHNFIEYNKIIETNYYPGMLQQRLVAGAFELEIKEIGVSERTTMTIFQVTNTSLLPQTSMPVMRGKITYQAAGVAVEPGYVTIKIDKNKHSLVLKLPEGMRAQKTGKAYLAQGNAQTLPPGARTKFVSFCTYMPAECASKALSESNKFTSSQAETLLAANRALWQQRIKSVAGRKSGYMKTPRYRDWAIKALITLNTNWKSAAGDLKHSGLFPSVVAFNAFWAWDSWMHAAGVSLYNPELAKEQMLTMFDFQTEEGMVPDLICLDHTQNNTVCSKPPLAGWGAYMVYQRTKDKEFVRKIYPKLKKFHLWRYKYRDHNKNGLCEYGGTAPDELFAQWESGMDVSVKFEGARMIRIADGAYSFDQESVELNSYLYAEKLYLAYLAEVAGKVNDAEKFRNEASSLRKLIQEKMFDKQSGYFYDIKSETGKHVKVIDVSGWIPLFTGAATLEQAKSVKKIMLDTKLFGTFFPFSSLNHEHPKYQPDKGYFRGQTWMNYVYFGIRGLKNYGFNKEAKRLTQLLPDRLEGIADRGFPIRENYSSATGEGLCVKNFSWSSVFSLLLLLEDSESFAYIPDWPKM